MLTSIVRQKICVTGSNGKTTTTLMITYLLKNAGFNVKAVGNIGDSYAFAVATNPADYYVIELSSFQLDRMYDFKADIALLLNITSDHLDRYDNQFSKYADSKFRITQNLDEKSHFIYNAEDVEINKRHQSVKSSYQAHPVFYSI